MQETQQPASPIPLPTPVLTPELGQLIMNSGQLQVFDSNGTEQIRLPAAGDDPRWSPDGTSILFKSNRSTAVRLGSELQQNYPISSAIMVVNADGTNLKTLHTFYRGGSPDWSPDGEYIVFAAAVTSDDQRPDLYTMKKDGTQVRLLLDCGNIMSGCKTPRWSPDGETIAYVSDKLELIHVNELERTTLYPQSVGGLQWSPNGEYLLFYLDNALYVLTKESGHVEEIVRKETDENITSAWFHPTWSPSGEQIIYGLTYEDQSLYDTSDTASPSRPLRHEAWVTTRDGSKKAQIPELFINHPIDWKSPHLP